MATNDLQEYDSTFSNSYSTTVILQTEETVRMKKAAKIAPFFITLMTIATIPYMDAADTSFFSQPLTVCQSIDVCDSTSKEEILKQFFTKLVVNSKDIDPEIAEIVNKNYKKLLW